MPHSPDTLGRSQVEVFLATYFLWCSHAHNASSLLSMTQTAATPFTPKPFHRALVERTPLCPQPLLTFSSSLKPDSYPKETYSPAVLPRGSCSLIHLSPPPHHPHSLSIYSTETWAIRWKCLQPPTFPFPTFLNLFVFLSCPCGKRSSSLLLRQSPFVHVTSSFPHLFSSSQWHKTRNKRKRNKYSLKK